MVLDDVLSSLRVIFELLLFHVDVLQNNRVDESIPHVVVQQPQPQCFDDPKESEALVILAYEPSNGQKGSDVKFKLLGAKILACHILKTLLLGLALLVELLLEEGNADVSEEESFGDAEQPEAELLCVWKPAQSIGWVHQASVETIGYDDHVPNHVPLRVLSKSVPRSSLGFRDQLRLPEAPRGFMRFMLLLGFSTRATFLNQDVDNFILQN